MQVEKVRRSHVVVKRCCGFDSFAAAITNVCMDNDILYTELIDTVMNSDAPDLLRYTALYSERGPSPDMYRTRLDLFFEIGQVVVDNKHGVIIVTCTFPDYEQFLITVVKTAFPTVISSQQRNPAEQIIKHHLDYRANLKDIRNLHEEVSKEKFDEANLISGIVLISTNLEIDPGNIPNFTLGEHNYIVKGLVHFFDDVEGRHYVGSCRLDGFDSQSWTDFDDLFAKGPRYTEDICLAKLLIGVETPVHRHNIIFF